MATGLPFATTDYLADLELQLELGRVRERAASPGGLQWVAAHRHVDKLETQVGQVAEELDVVSSVLGEPGWDIPVGHR